MEAIFSKGSSVQRKVVHSYKIDNLTDKLVLDFADGGRIELDFHNNRNQIAEMAQMFEDVTCISAEKQSEIDELESAIVTLKDSNDKFSDSNNLLKRQISHLEEKLKKYEGTDIEKLQKDYQELDKNFNKLLELTNDFADDYQNFINTVKGIKK